MFAAMNNEQLSAMLAENLMGLLNNAMIHINTSLSKNLPQVSMVDAVHQRAVETVRGIQENPKINVPRPGSASKIQEADTKRKDQAEYEITDENMKSGYKSAGKVNPFRKPVLQIRTEGLDEDRMSTQEKQQTEANETEEEEQKQNRYTSADLRDRPQRSILQSLDDQAKEI